MPAATMEGKPVPQVEWTVYQDGKWSKLTTDDVFKGKTVALFSLPGAFTPTCSSTHLPRYDELYDTFKANGVDEVYCLSVNDSFVMNEWGVQLGVKNVKLLADGNGEFTEKMGMLVEKKNLGFGARSWRYSMIVKDGVVEKMFVEPEKEGDPFEVSDADTMLKHIAPNVAAPPPVVIFTKPGCPFCAKAKELLTSKKLKFEELSGKSSAVLAAVSGRKTVPQVFIGGKHIGGSDDLEKYLADKQF